MITRYHAKYFAYELTRTGGTGIDRLGRALFDSVVDLNPHQIEAALFALRSPLSKGVLLADEVGLGKTIEAGLALSQYWAEKKRRILVICPASLRKQWSIELQEKFNLPSMVLDGRAFKQLQAKDISNPFESPEILICSMHFAAQNEEFVKEVPWHLIVIDEAHKLRNSYRASNKIGQAIRRATFGGKKLLLTATPLQNSLLELYGLATLIDDKLFGELPSFRTQYIQYGGDNEGLRERLKNFCWRTLRSQVQEFIRYTNRKLITRPFLPTDQEQKLYNAVSDYLARDDAYALPKGQRHLLILIVRKVLASSPRALAGTLEKMKRRLMDLREDYLEHSKVVFKPWEIDEWDEEMMDELLEDQEDQLLAAEAGQEYDVDTRHLDEIDINALNAEINELDDYIRWARSIGIDTKAKELLKGLQIGFEQLEVNGAAPKAVIFTESKRTQMYLKEFLEANGYLDKVVTFNGQNRNPDSATLYHRWLDKHGATGRATGSRPVDIRTAIIDKFREDAQVLIATEAAGEGINLQFCSMVVNFDLPWNPQRIEQRIGRCHRYGQKYDVVVINFINQRNEADKRVYELLEKKFQLFSGVFGASDEVLGTLAAGMDFERRVMDIYKECRTTEQIQTAFEKLQAELDEEIQQRLQDTRRILLEHFDEEVHALLKVNLSGTKKKLDRISLLFWELTRFMLNDRARFDDQSLSFQLAVPYSPAIPSGRYRLISKEKENTPGIFLYRLGHPLGESLLSQAKSLECPLAGVEFDITNHPRRISLVEKLKGKEGWLVLQHLVVDSYERQEYLLFSGFDQEGNSLDHETADKLFNCKARLYSAPEAGETIQKRLEEESKRYREATLYRNLEENNKFFEESREQLDKWAEDMELAAEKELDEVKRKIRDLRRQAQKATTMQEQKEKQEALAKLEKKKTKLRQKIFDVEDQIEAKRDTLVSALERRLQQKAEHQTLFSIHWKVV